MHTGHRVAKEYGRARQAGDEFNRRNVRLYEAGWRAQFVSGVLFPLINSIGNLGFVLIAVIGGILVTQGGILIGDVQAFIQYARQFSQPITQLASIANAIQLTIASAERVFELLDEPDEQPEAADAVVIAEPHGAVQFDHVDFSYTPEAPLIEDMNIDAKPGQTVAIV